MPTTDFFTTFTEGSAEASPSPDPQRPTQPPPASPNISAVAEQPFDWLAELAKMHLEETKGDGGDTATFFEEYFETSGPSDPLVGRFRELLVFILNDLIMMKPSDPLHYVTHTMLLFPFESCSRSGRARPTPPARAIVVDEQGSDAGLVSAFTPTSDQLSGSMHNSCPPLNLTPGWSSAAAGGSPSSVGARCPRCSTVPISESYGMPHLSLFADNQMTFCCTYELKAPFEKGHRRHTTDILTRFFNSNDTVMVIVGDDDETVGSITSRLRSEITPAAELLSNRCALPLCAKLHSSLSNSGAAACFQTPQMCHCTGSGKSRLMRWLDFPGRFIHGRKVLRINSSNAEYLISLLEQQSSPQPDPQSNASSCSSPLNTRKPISNSFSRGSNEKPQQRLLSKLSVNRLFSNSNSSVMLPDFGSISLNSATALPRATTLTASVLMQRDGYSGSPVEVISLSNLDPTLTLIDSIEPPHSILHALHQYNYFRTERAVRCPLCHVMSHNVAVHKTIVFTRRDVFFKFPIPCPIYVVSRHSHLAHAESDVLLEDTFNGRRMVSSFLMDMGDTGERSGLFRSLRLEVSRRRLAGAKALISPRQTEVPLPQYTYHEPNNLINFRFCQNVINELQECFQISRRGLGNPYVTLIRCPLSLDSSITFRTARVSRCRAELALATYMVAENVIPTLDFSEFPLLTSYIVATPRSDLYILRLLLKVREQLRTASVDRLLVGNLLCLAVRSQQCLSVHHSSVTAFDALQLYMNAFLGNASDTFTPKNSFALVNSTVMVPAQAGTGYSTADSSHSCPASTLARTNTRISFVEGSDVQVTQKENPPPGRE